VLSVGVFFSLMVVGLSAKLPGALHHGLVQHGVANADATRIAELPPGATIFASFLGYNPAQTLLGSHVLAGLSPVQRHDLTGRSFFPQLISSPFHSALLLAFAFAIVSCALSALGSLARGPRYQAAECDAPEAAVVTYESV
jgi:hypothetical protein